MIPDWLAQQFLHPISLLSLENDWIDFLVTKLLSFRYNVYFSLPHQSAVVGQHTGIALIRQNILHAGICPSITVIFSFVDVLASISISFMQI